MIYNPEKGSCPNCGEMGIVFEYEDDEAIEYKCVICGYKFFIEKNKYENK